LTRVREAGGEVLQEPEDRGPMVGILAYIKDTVGNRIGLHQPFAGM
jgi:predicted enzyme related to lactoylglutathione lyase